MADGPGIGARVRRIGTVRVKATVAAVLVVGIAMAVGGVALVAALRAALTDDVRAAARLRAEDVAGAIEADAGAQLTVGEADEEYIQVLDAGGEVVASSDNVAGRPPLVRPSPGSSVRFDPPLGDDDFVAAAAAAVTPSGQLTVVVGRALDPVSDSTETVTGLLGIAAPLLLALVGATTWAMVGRALIPVEAIRSEVDAISTTELHRRVPVPAAEDEVARLAGTMNRMLARLQDGQGRQNQFVADASHELRSPIASIRQHAEVARAHPGRVPLDDLTETVVAESVRMQRLVDDLLLLARADEPGLQLPRHPIDLDDVVFAEAARLRTGTHLRIDTRQVSAGRVDGDGPGLRRVLRNLGENAAHHARATVAFSLTDDGETVRLAVDDDGPGVAVDDRARIFDRFVRLDGARTRDDGGTGLGLAIVAEIVRSHSGRVEVLESPLGGARFLLSLPSGGDIPS